MGTCVKIEVKDDGSVTVSPCQPDPQPSAAGQQFASIDEAMEAAKGMLTPNPEQQAVQADQQAGFDSVQQPGAAGAM